MTRLPHLVVLLVFLVELLQMMIRMLV